MGEKILSVLLKTTPSSGGGDPNYRALIPLSAVQQIRQTEEGVSLITTSGNELRVHGAWKAGYYDLLSGPDMVDIAPKP